MEQNAAGTALFGTQWEDVKAKVILAMQEGVKGIGDFKGKTDEASKAMYDNNPASALTGAMRGLQAAVSPALLPLANIITVTLVPALQGLAAWFTNLGPAGQKTVLAVLGIIAIIGPALVIIGSLISAVGVITTAFTAAGVSITAAGGIIAILTGPVAIAIAIIAGLIAIGVLLYQNWDTISAKARAFGAAAGEVFRAFGAAAGAAVNAVIGFFSNLRLPEIKIPKIKMPHFSMSGAFSISPPSIPSFGVDWYKTGGIFNSPSVIGVGEAGQEAVLPIDRLSGLMADALNGAGGGATGGTSEVKHSGTITVKGVNSAGEIQGVIDIILDNLGMEARLA